MKNLPPFALLVKLESQALRLLLCVARRALALFLVPKPSVAVLRCARLDCRDLALR